MSRDRRFRVALTLTAGLLCPLSVAASPPPGFVDTPIVFATTSTGSLRGVAIGYEPGSGHLYIVEKGPGIELGEARVRVRDAITSAVSTALTLDCVDGRAERGLLGIAFSPDYLTVGGTSRFVYLFYTRRFTESGPCAVGGVAEGTKIRVSRFIESGMQLSGEEVVWEGPFLGEGIFHFGGTLRFAPDGTLFVSIGDNDTDAEPNPLSRDLSDPRGKILRLNADGSIPPDNPFVGQPGVLPEIFAWGLRNPFRFSLDSETGTPLIADVGEVTWEAIYAGAPGADFGYPCFEGVAPFRVCDPAPPPGSVTSPILVYGHENQTPPISGNSVIGGPVYDGETFPEEYRRNYFFADYADHWIRRGRLTADGQLVDIEPFHDAATSVVDMVVSPEGCLTWVSLVASGPSVIETCYVGGENEQPRAIASAEPTSGLATLPVQFTGSASSDPDGDSLLYAWDFGDSASSTSADPLHAYSEDGVYHAVLTVDDQQSQPNSTDSAPPLRIVVGNRQPTPSLEQPAGGTRYNAGDTITFSGTASDPEDGTLAAAALSWNVVFHHDVHTHPFQGPIDGVPGGSFTVPTNGEDATNVFFRIHLTATDSGSPLGAGAELSATTTVDVLPNVSQITLAADPPALGLQLAFDNELGTAPVVRDSVVNFPRTIAAPAAQVVGAITWVFDAWSDAGAASHQIATPSSDTTYTATYRCGQHLLGAQTIDETVVFENCDSLVAGDGFEVLDIGHATLRARSSVELRNGMRVQDGGQLTIELLP